jgi:hypothetical protein
MTVQQPQVKPAEITNHADSTLTSRLHQAWRWGRHHHWVVALAGYALMTLVVTFPLVLHLGDSIAGPYLYGDSFWYTWYPYAFRTSLAAGQDPSTTHLLYALLPHIQLFAVSYVNGGVGAFLLSFMTPLVVFNILMLLNFALSGLTTYLLVNEFVPNRWAAFIAGGMYTFSTYHFWRVISGLSLTSMQYMPLAAWRVFAFYRRPTWRNAIFMGLSIALMPLSDLYLSAYFLPVFVPLFLVGIFVANRAWFRVRQNVIRGAVGLLITVTVAFPFLVSSLRVTPDIQASIAQKASSTEHFSANLIAFFLPSAKSPLFGGLTAPAYANLPAGISEETANYVGWVVLTLAIFGFVVIRPRLRAMRFWLVFGVAEFLLSLGPTLTVERHLVIPLPFFRLLYGLPVLSNYRAPNRFAPAIQLAACVLAAYGLAALFARARAYLDAHRDAPTRLRYAAVPALGVVVICASLAESIPFSFPYPFTYAPIPPVFQQMADDPVPGLVLTLPVYPKGQDMFYQTITHRGLVTGYPIRTTYPMIRTFENIPGVSLFDWPDTVQANDPAADDQGELHDVFPLRETMLQGLQANGIRYVVLRADTTGPTGRAFPAILPWMRPYLERALGNPFYGSSAYGLWVWRIPRAAADPGVIRFAMGDGWMPGLQVGDNQVERRILQDGELDVTVPVATTTDLVITAMSVTIPRHMAVSVNGSLLKTVDLATPGTMQTVDLGVTTLRAGKNVLHFADTQECVDPGASYPHTLDPKCISFEVASLQMPDVTP